MLMRFEQSTVSLLFETASFLSSLNARLRVFLRISYVFCWTSFTFGLFISMNRNGNEIRYFNVKCVFSVYQNLRLKHQIKIKIFLWSSFKCEFKEFVELKTREVKVTPFLFF